MFIAGESGLPLKIFLKKTARNMSDNKVFLFSHARGGMEFFLRNLTFDHQRTTVLVPAYICKDFTDSIQSAGFNLEYYEVDDKLNPILSNLYSKIDERTLAVVIVHYFGFFCTVVDQIVRYCSSNGIKVVEDCAHLLFCDTSMKNIKGDVAIFSLKKLLPVPDGGVLFDNKGILNNNFSNYRLLPKYCLNIKINFTKLILKNILQTINYLPGRKYSPITDSGFDKSYLGMRRISNLSEVILKKIYKSGYLDIINNRRRKNFVSLVSLLNPQENKTSFTLMFSELSDKDIPYIFPLRSNCEVYDLVKRLRQKGIPVITWPRLDKNSIIFSSTERIRGKLLFFPLHENIWLRHIQYMVETFKHYVNHGR